MIPHSRPTLGAEEKAAVLAVLESGHIAQGEKVAEFEKAFCEFTGRRFAVAVSSGTAALQLSLLGLGISSHDQVVIPSYTCSALLHAVGNVGARPLIADVDIQDFNLSLSSVKRMVTRKTKAIIIPHAFGLPAFVERFQEWGIPVIEDGTQALGACVGGQKVGRFGPVSVFSFYATKMVTTGEGGMILADSPRLAEKLLDMRDYDKKEVYRFRTNSKMTDLEAALGLVQLKKLPAFLARRRALASRYQAALKDSGLTLPTEEKGRDHVFYRFVVRVPKGKKEFMNRLLHQGIEVKEPVFRPLHRYLDLPDSKFPATLRAMKESCSLPLYPSLSDEASDQVCEAIRDFLVEPKAERARLLTA